VANDILWPIGDLLGVVTIFGEVAVFSILLLLELREVFAVYPLPKPPPYFLYFPFSPFTFG
jgi:hypothetical protein